ncbi:MAG: hypothetical protein A2V90_04330, partial [Gammaproteobacteria bacterium RBG_16_57_12]
LASELGGRAGDYFAATTLNYQQDDISHHMVRELTWLRKDDRSALRTLIAGDYVATSGGVRPSTVVLGGISLTKNFAMTPYYSTAPSLDLQGVATSPSEAEVYVNGYRVSRERLAPGEFTLQNIPAQTGYGMAEVVITDAYGREQVISENYYIAQQLLRKGLNEYNHSIGFLREDFSEKSFSYGDPVLISSFRRGLSDQHTLGYALNMTQNHVDVSPGAALRLGNAGVLGIGVGLSRNGGKSGIGGAFDYIFQSRLFNSSFSVKGFSEDYATLTLKADDNKPAFQLDAVVGVTAREYGSVSFKYTAARYHHTPDMLGYGFFYNRALGRRWHMFLTANRTQEQGQASSYDMFLGLNLSLGGNVSGNLGYTRTDSGYRRDASVQKQVSAGHGPGFLAEYQDMDGDSSWRGEASYHSGYGTYEARYQDNGNYLLSAAGGVGYIDHALFFNRPFNDSFAKVDVGVPDVRVYYFGNEVAATDARGVAILPDIHAFHDNKIDIAAADIPLDYKIATLTAYLNPPYRSGSLIHFDVSRVRGIIGRLVMEQQGVLVPVEHGEMEVSQGDQIYQGMIGRGGEFYIENLPTGGHSAEVLYQSGRCQAWLDVPGTDDVLVDIGEVRCMAK